ncbi:MAG: hypothetical protein PVG33_04025, partial [Chloroflexota bacterium]
LDPALVRRCGLRPYEEFDLALNDALREVGPDPAITVMPIGSAVLPAAKKASQVDSMEMIAS